MTIDTSRVASVLRQAGAIAAIVLGYLNTIHTTGPIRGILVGAGSALLLVEHIAAALPNTTTPPHPVTTATIVSPVTGVTTSTNAVVMPPPPPKGNLGSPH